MRVHSGRQSESQSMQVDCQLIGEVENMTFESSW